MKAAQECYECLQRLARQAADLATKDERIKMRAIEEGLKVLERDFSTDEVTIVIATGIHDVVKRITRNPDPYRKMKEKKIDIAGKLSHKMRANFARDFEDCLKLAALGNAMDFFRSQHAVSEDFRRPVDFVIDDSSEFEAKLKHARKVMYLADNAGEPFFDLPLLKNMREYVCVTYVVKASPVQNDVTLQDIARAGLKSEIGKVITTGTATPGVDFSLASPQFKREFEAVDLIFAKGMGYYESLSELPAEGKIFHCLMAKCKPVADSLGVRLNSYVAMLR